MDLEFIVLCLGSRAIKLNADVLCKKHVRSGHLVVDGMKDLLVFKSVHVSAFLKYKILF